jgi:hypothetical protein
MENTIFQFLKVLFWNKDIHNYDFNKIKEIINNEYLDFINNIFININNEKTLTFINTCVVFITELSNVHNNKYGSYDFNHPELQIELNPSVNNLILALKYLIKWDDDNYDIDNTTFMSNLISKINKDYKVNITSEIITKNEKINKIDKIELIFYNKKYLIKLNYEQHATFENSIDNNYILYYIKRANITNPNNLIKYLNNTSFAFYNLNAYLIYSYLSKKSDICYKFITKIDRNIQIDIINDYISTFKTDITFLYHLIVHYKNILEKNQIIVIYDQIVIYIIIEPNVLDFISDFNQDIMMEFKYNHIITILDLPVYRNINASNIKSTFINKLIKYEIYNTFNNKLWLAIITFNNLFNKFINILNSSIISKWDLSVWFGICYYYNYRINNKLEYKIILEKLIRTKFNSKYPPNIPIETLIESIISNIPENDWYIIFNNKTYNLCYCCLYGCWSLEYSYNRLYIIFRYKSHIIR